MGCIVFVSEFFFFFLGGINLEWVYTEQTWHTPTEKYRAGFIKDMEDGEPHVHFTARIKYICTYAERVCG